MRLALGDNGLELLDGVGVENERHGVSVIFVVPFHAIREALSRCDDQRFSPFKNAHLGKVVKF